MPAHPLPPALPSLMERPRLLGPYLWIQPAGPAGSLPPETGVWDILGAELPVKLWVQNVLSLVLRIVSRIQVLICWLLAVTPKEITLPL